MKKEQPTVFTHHRQVLDAKERKNQNSSSGADGTVIRTGLKIDISRNILIGLVPIDISRNSNMSQR